MSKHIKNQLLFFEEQAARLKKMEEEEKRKKAEFRKKVRPLNVLSKTKWICGAGLFWPPSLILLFITCIFYLDGERGVWFHPRQFTTEKKIQSHGEDWKEYIVHTIFLSLLSKISIYLPWNIFLPHLSILLRFHLFLSLRHDVAEVAGLTSFSFGEDEESRYVMLFKKVRVLWNPVLDLKTIFLVLDDWWENVVLAGVCSIRWGAGSLSQGRRVGPPAGRTAAQTKSKTGAPLCF